MRAFSIPAGSFRFQAKETGMTVKKNNNAVSHPVIEITSS